MSRECNMRKRNRLLAPNHRRIRFPILPIHVPQSFKPLPSTSLLYPYTNVSSIALHHISTSSFIRNPPRCFHSNCKSWFGNINYQSNWVPSLEEQVSVFQGTSRPSSNLLVDRRKGKTTLELGRVPSPEKTLSDLLRPTSSNEVLSGTQRWTTSFGRVFSSSIGSVRVIEWMEVYVVDGSEYRRPGGVSGDGYVYYVKRVVRLSSRIRIKDEAVPEAVFGERWFME
ncbi:hypothetical protein K435DRAFT_808101 [Dendrothele bispora CBS 962.96]|uniref:Uncharacterized protein n=1 Tax=Dendrothele bispora (strain CBS 962.96) TaxID=1314807 RepID=A0A4S8L2K5_DENBC|nr:hypothetical protein K435DRAFT_808101 [Dendrothele bispora CBS 962.96]